MLVEIMLESLSRRLFKGFRRTPEDHLRAARLVACDLDGTLLNRHDRLAETTIRLVRKVEALGIRFVLITRRQHQAVEPYADAMSLTEPIISLDGAMTCGLYENEPIDGAMLDPELALAICEETGYTENVRCALITPHGFVSNDPAMLLPAHHQHWNIEFDIVSDFAPVIEQGNILEVIATGGFHAVNNVFNYVEQRMRRGELKLRMYESHSRSDSWYLEIRSAGATKSAALERLLARHGIAFEEVIGIGDNYNDLDFCRKSGYVVAVRNAVDELKEIADYITKRDFHHVGIDEFLRYFLEFRAAASQEPQRGR